MTPNIALGIDDMHGFMGSRHYADEPVHKFSGPVIAKIRTAYHLH
jgi:hypothetical protein